MSNSMFGADFGGPALDMAYDLMMLDMIEDDEKDENDEDNEDDEDDEKDERILVLYEDGNIPAGGPFPFTEQIKQHFWEEMFRNAGLFKIQY